MLQGTVSVAVDNFLNKISSANENENRKFQFIIGIRWMWFMYDTTSCLLNFLDSFLIKPFQITLSLNPRVCLGWPGGTT